MIPEQNLLPQVIPLQSPRELQSGELTSQKFWVHKGLGKGCHAETGSFWWLRTQELGP